MGLNWKGALEKGFATGAQGMYKRYEHNLKEEEAQADFNRQQHLELLKQQGSKELATHRASLLEQANVAEDKRMRSRALEGRASDWETSAGVGLTAMEIEGKTPEELKKLGYVNKIDKAIALKEREVMNAVNLEHAAMSAKDALTAKDTFKVLQDNGDVDPAISFDQWYAKKQYTDMFAKQGIPVEQYMELVGKASESFDNLATNDPNAYKLRMTAAGNNAAVAKATYVKELVTGIVDDWKGTQPTKGGTAKGASDLALVDILKNMPDEEAIRKLADEKDLPLDTAADEWLKLKARMGVQGGARRGPGKEKPKTTSVLEEPTPKMFGASPQFEGGSILGSAKAGAKRLRESEDIFGM